LDRREADERICILVPKRNIETWIHALFGRDVNENERYPKLKREGDCQPAVEQLITYLREGLPDEMIPSLRHGGRELNERLPE
jgi:hypothetical protein